MRDLNEFDAFYAASSPRLVNQLFAMTGNLSEAEDALQEAYIRAWQRWPRISRYENPEGWVRSVAFKLAVNSWWKTKNRLTAHRRAAGRDEEVPGLNPDLPALVKALRLIPEKQRRALVLHYVADMTVEQIAAETGAAPSTVKAQLSRGRAALAPLVSELAGDARALRRTTR